MNVFRNNFNTAYEIKNKKLIFIRQKHKMKFWHKGKYLHNARFSVKPHKQWRFFHWLIRLPFFYFERNNSGIRIGTNNRYIWIFH